MKNYKEYKMVRNMNTLKMLEKANLIKFHYQTGTKISGLYDNKLFTCYYIDSSTSTRFTYKNKSYEVKYLSGCFCPYVFLIN